MAKYTQGKPDAQELAQAFFKRMQDNAPAMYEVIKTAIAELNDAQGEWVSVDEVYAPTWTHLIKSAVSQLEAVLAAIDGEGKNGNHT